ncbi:retrovirus-related Pol polyprotein from transposon RE2 [Trichonephila clavipes]|uniref:Retrovirus-related Pol polyprotein from transposon RE2 n=1 Tax=Trichonephila clavipes TaxID=2585209 RepID=A0A8X6S6N8_TRICX|nr:retrovirus-related Pol polyprotein from transposon RE2 [Trichonephila clavipes]
MLLEEWTFLPQELLDNQVLSKRRRSGAKQGEDDLATFCNNDKLYEDIVSKIKNVFEVVENKTNKSLGMEIEKYENGIYLSQCDYINSLLDKDNLENCKSVITPIVKGEDKNFPSTNEFIDITMNQELIGELLYLANRTRPDISFVTSYLSQFNHNPEKRHYNLAKQVLRYLMGSKDKKFFYEKEFGILNSSSDASWGKCRKWKIIFWRCSFNWWRGHREEGDLEWNETEVTNMAER